MPPENDNLRLPPHNEDAERSVLGSMMLEHMAVSVALQYLDAEAFYRPAHRKIFQAMFNLEDRSEPVDQISVVDELKRMGELESCGGAYYITELTDSIPSTANVEYYARLVMESATLRSLIQLSGQLATEAYETKEHVDDLLDRAESRIFDLSAKRFKQEGFKTLKPVIKETFELIDAIHKNPDQLSGVTTGYKDIDELTTGFQNSDLIILAARPSMGKTALALNIARNAAIDGGHPVGIFSLEMSAKSLALRLLCSEAEVDAHSVRTGRLKSPYWTQLTRAAGRLSDAPIYVDESASLNVTELRAKARRLKADKDIQLLIVDYLQLLQGHRGAESRQQEISQISRSLKILAKELDLPVLALSQLSRAVETRGGDRRPILSDLRESGSIEQDADIVMFIYREERYVHHEDERFEDVQGKAELIVAKQRNGPTDTVKLQFEKTFAKFRNLSTIDSAY